MLRQFAGVLGRAAAIQISGRSHAQAAVVRNAHADQSRVGQVTHAHSAVKTFTGQIDHAVAQIQRNGDIGVQIAETRHQRCDVATAKAGRGGNAQMTRGLDAASGNAGLGIAHIGEQALAIFQKRAAFVGERDAARGAHHELDAQMLFQSIQSASHDGGRYAFGLGGSCQAASGRY